MTSLSPGPSPSLLSDVPRPPPAILRTKVSVKVTRRRMAWHPLPIADKPGRHHVCDGAYLRILKMRVFQRRRRVGMTKQPADDPNCASLAQRHAGIAVAQADIGDGSVGPESLPEAVDAGDRPVRRAAGKIHRLHRASDRGCASMMLCAVLQSQMVFATVLLSGRWSWRAPLPPTPLPSSRYQSHSSVMISDLRAPVSAISRTMAVWCGNFSSAPQSSRPRSTNSSALRNAPLAGACNGGCRHRGSAPPDGGHRPSPGRG